MLKKALQISQAQVSDLQKKVNISSVQSVKQAIQERDHAYKALKKGIADANASAQAKINEAVEKRNNAENKASEARLLLKKRSFLYLGLLALLLVLISIKSDVFIVDFFNLVNHPINYFFQFTQRYIAWLHTPTYPDGAKIIDHANGWLWLIRVIAILLVTAILLVSVFCIYIIVKTYIQRWCTLSLKVWVLTYASLILFAEKIKTIIPANLLLLLFLTQVLYLSVLKWLDHFFDKRFENEKWAEIQNR